jgi:hypothetical protein
MSSLFSAALMIISLRLNSLMHRHLRIDGEITSSSDTPSKQSRVL